MGVKKYFKDIKKISEILNSDGKKMLFYHGDADGVCSAALVGRYFYGFEFQSRRGPMMDTKFVNYLIESKPDILVFLDLPVDQELKELQRIVKKLPKIRILIIDHHIFDVELNTKNITHVNPRFHDRDAYLPASYLVYKMIELMGKDVKDVKDDIWLSVIGIIGDYGVECTDVLGECRKEYPELIGEDMFSSRLAEGSEMINAAVTLFGFRGMDEIFKSLIKAHSYDDFGEKSKFKKWKHDIDQEIKKIMARFETEKKKSESKVLEMHKGIIFYLIETELSLNATISTLITKKHDDDVVMVIRKAEDDHGYKISSRCQSGRVDVAALMKKATKGIGNGGGHPKAAGAFTVDLGMFKSRVIRELK